MSFKEKLGAERSEFADKTAREATHLELRSMYPSRSRGQMKNEFCHFINVGWNQAVESVLRLLREEGGEIEVIKKERREFGEMYVKCEFKWLDLFEKQKEEIAFLKERLGPAGYKMIQEVPKLRKALQQIIDLEFEDQNVLIVEGEETITSASKIARAALGGT